MDDGERDSLENLHDVGQGNTAVTATRAEGEGGGRNTGGSLVS